MVSVSAVSGFDRIWSKLGRGIKMSPNFVLGTGNEVFSKALHDSFYGVKDAAGNVTQKGSYFKNFWTQIKQAALKSEKHNAAQITAHGGFFKNMGYQLKTTPKYLRRAWKAGANKAGQNAGFLAKALGGLKGSLKAIGKRMPLIGALLMVGFELPNIIKRTKDEGIIAGLKETAKSTARIAGSMAGFAIGQALIPIPLIGGIIGAMAGDKLTSLVVGKSYSEKKAEQTELAQAQIPSLETNGFNNPFATSEYATNPQQKFTVSPQELQQMELMLRNGYGLKDNFDAVA